MKPLITINTVLIIVWYLGFKENNERQYIGGRGIFIVRLPWALVMKGAFKCLAKDSCLRILLKAFSRYCRSLPEDPYL